MSIKDISVSGPELSVEELERVAGGRGGNAHTTNNKKRTAVASKVNEAADRFEPHGTDTDESVAPILE